MIVLLCTSSSSKSLTAENSWNCKVSEGFQQNIPALLSFAGELLSALWLRCHTSNSSSTLITGRRGLEGAEKGRNQKDGEARGGGEAGWRAGWGIRSWKSVSSWFWPLDVLGTSERRTASAGIKETGQQFKQKNKKRWGEIRQNKSLVWPTNIKQENWEKNQKEAGRYLETLEQDGSFPHTWREKKTGLVEGETLDALLTAAPHQTLQSMSLLKPNESGEEAPPRNGNLWAEGGFKSQQKIQVCSWKLLQNNVKDWLW